MSANKQTKKSEMKKSIKKYPLECVLLNLKDGR